MTNRLFIRIASLFHTRFLTRCIDTFQHSGICFQQARLRQSRDQLAPLRTALEDRGKHRDGSIDTSVERLVNFEFDFQGANG